jgi:hypothetical protein
MRSQRFLLLTIPFRSNSSYWRIGTILLKNYYTVFRYDPPSVGFAKLSENAQPDVKGTNPSWASPAMGISTVAAGAAVVAILLL